MCWNCLPLFGLLSFVFPHLLVWLAQLGLAVPVSTEDKALTLFHAAQKLIDELAGQPDKVKQKLAQLADMMGRAAGNGLAR